MKATNRTSNGTSFHGNVITTTPQKLIDLAKKLGADYYFDNSGEDKVNLDMEFETSEGDVFTVYDWKEYASLDMNRNYEFHIGCENRSIGNTAKEELQKELNNPN